MSREPSKSPSAWTPERRAAQAERMRALSASPGIKELRIAAFRASPKARAASRRNIAKCNADADAQARGRAWMKTPEGKERLREMAAHLKHVRVNDIQVRQQWLSSQAIKNSSRKQRAAAARTIKQVRERPEVIAANATHLARLHGDADVQARRIATRKAGKVPKGFGLRYRKLRDLVGANVAMGIVHREAKMARVNR